MKRGPVLFLSLLILGACSSPNVAPEATLRADAGQGEAPLVVNFTAQASDPEGAPLTYTWDVGEGEPFEGGRSYAYVYREPGSYPVTLTVSDGVNERESTLTVEVEASSAPRDPNNEPPTVELGADVTEGTAPLTVRFTANAQDVNGDDLAYSLNFGDTLRTAAPAATHTYREPGTYVATVVVEDGRGGAALGEATVTVTAPE